MTTKHGMHNTPEYTAWSHMKDRCRNPRAKEYHYYGERGITVCERWDSFEAFFADMGPKPSSDYTLERIDNDGPYSSDNCRWATWTDQQRNKRNANKVMWRGEMRSLMDLSEEYGVKQATIRYRLKRGWTLEDAVTRPANVIVRLIAEDARAIREQHAQGVHRNELSERFGITAQHVSQIIRGDRWSSARS